MNKDNPQEPLPYSKSEQIRFDIRIRCTYDALRGFERQYSLFTPWGEFFGRTCEEAFTQAAKAIPSDFKVTVL